MKEVYFCHNDGAGPKELDAAVSNNKSTFILARFLIMRIIGGLNRLLKLVIDEKADTRTLDEGGAVKAAHPRFFFFCNRLCS